MSSGCPPLEGLAPGGVLSAELEAHLAGCDRCLAVIAGLARSQTRFVAGAQILHYRLVRPLGQGAAGEVFEAEDLELGRSVAIKLARARLRDDPALRERLREEARTIARLSHPRIASVHAIEADGEDVFIVMERAVGEPLGQRLRRGPLPWREALAIFTQVADALAAVHAAGLVHRDVKPDNLIVDAAGAVKVVDFGLALAAGERRGIAGTPRYMSPEALAGAPPSPASDQFAFAVSFYEALTGAPPWRGDDVSELRSNQQGLRPERPPELPGWLWRLLERALARQPAERHASMHDLASALLDIPRRRQRRLRLALAGLGLTALVSVLLVSRPLAPTHALVPEGADWPPGHRLALAARLAVLRPGDRAAVWRQLSRSLDRADRRAPAGNAQLPPRWQGVCAAEQRLHASAALRAAETPGLERVADPGVVVSMLAAVHDCGSAERLAIVERTLASPGPAAMEEQLMQLKKAELLYAMRRRDEAWTLRLAAVDRALAAAAPDLVALARFELASQAQGESRPGVDELLIAAEAAAEAAADDRLRLRTLILRIYFHASHQELEVGNACATRADGVLQRLGSPPELAARVARARSTLAWQAGKTEEAVAAARRALEIAEQAFGADDAEVATFLLALSRAEESAGDLEDAYAAIQRAKKIWVASWGADHPGGVTIYLQSASVAMRLEHAAEARVDAEHGLTLIPAGPLEHEARWMHCLLTRLDLDALRLDDAAAHLALLGEGGCGSNPAFRLWSVRMAAELALLQQRPEPARQALEVLRAAPGAGDDAFLTIMAWRLSRLEHGAAPPGLGRAVDALLAEEPHAAERPGLRRMLAWTLELGDPRVAAACERLRCQAQ